jgi:hypothetical protein
VIDESIAKPERKTVLVRERDRFLGVLWRGIGRTGNAIEPRGPNRYKTRRVDMVTSVRFRQRLRHPRACLTKITQIRQGYRKVGQVHGVRVFGRQEPCASPRSPISGAFSKKFATSEWRHELPVHGCLALSWQRFPNWV